jgi:hypothetical protein
MSGLNRKGTAEQGPVTGRRMERCNPDNKGKRVQKNPQNQMTSLPFLLKRIHNQFHSNSSFFLYKT